MIEHVRENKKDYLPLLLLADEQENMIDRYLERGEMFVLIRDDSPFAVMVLTDEGDGILEIKNLAVRPDAQMQGIGRKMIGFAVEFARGRYHTLQVGTGDSPMTVPFYEKCGFIRSHVIKHFFTTHYDHPIVEDGVLLDDMVVFRQSIPQL